MNRDHLMGYTGHLRALLGDEYPQKLSVKRPARVPAPPGHSEAMAKLDRDETKGLPNPRAKKAPFVKSVGMLRVAYNGVEIKGENEVIDSGVNGLVQYKSRVHREGQPAKVVNVVIDGKSVPFEVSDAVRSVFVGNTIGYRAPEDSISTLHGQLKMLYCEVRDQCDKGLDEAMFEVLKFNHMYVDVLAGRWEKVGSMNTGALADSIVRIKRLLGEYRDGLPKPKKAKAAAPAPTRSKLIQDIYEIYVQAGSSKNEQFKDKVDMVMGYVKIETECHSVPWTVLVSKIEALSDSDLTATLRRMQRTRDRYCPGDAPPANEELTWSLDTVRGERDGVRKMPDWYANAHRIANAAAKSVNSELRAINSAAARNLVTNVFGDRMPSKGSITQLVSFYCQACMAITGQEDQEYQEYYERILNVQQLSPELLLNRVPSEAKCGDFMRLNLQAALNEVDRDRKSIAGELEGDDEDNCL